MAGKTISIISTILDANNIAPWTAEARRAAGPYGLVRKSLTQGKVVTEKRPPSLTDTYVAEGDREYPMYPTALDGVTLTAKGQEEWRNAVNAFKNDLGNENKHHESYKTIVENSLSSTSRSKVISILGGLEALEEATLLELWDAIQQTHTPSTAAESIKGPT